MKEAEQQHEPPRPLRRTIRSLRRMVRVGIALLGLPILTAALLSFAAPAAWWLDVLTHFRPHYAIALVVLGAIQALAGPRWLAVAWATGGLLCVVVVSPYFLPRANAVAGETMTVAHANVMGDRVNVEALTAWIAATRPDVLSLQEITPRNLPRITAALEAEGLGYVLIAGAPREDTRGVALLSRRPGVVGAMTAVGADQDRPMAQAVFEIDGLPVALLGYHAARPAPGAGYRRQVEGIEGLVLWSAAYEVAGMQRLVLGDFNSTSQGTLARHLARRAGLRDGRLGRGLAGTWPAELPAWLRLPIDGVYVSEGLVVTRLEAGPPIGSDHLPVLASVAVRPDVSRAESPRFPPPGAASRGSWPQ